MPTNCFDRTNCANSACQAEIADAHKISSATFSSMVAAFFGTATVPAPLVISASSMASMTNVVCSENRIRFTVPDGTSTQQDITISVQSGYFPTTGDTDNFSIALFLGVLQFSPDEFRFYKAMDSQNRKTLAFEVVKDRTVVYIGDISSTYP